MNESIREAIIFEFVTDRGMARTLRLPDPKPVAVLSVNDVVEAGSDLIEADIFDEALVPSGRLALLSGAVREKVRTIPLF